MKNALKLVSYNLIFINGLTLFFWVLQRDPDEVCGDIALTCNK